MKLLESLKNKNLSEEICLLRVDFNFPVSKKFSNPRLKGIIPTLEFLVNKGAKIVIISHKGRPEINQKLPQFSLKPFAGIISRKIGKKVDFMEFDKSAGEKIIKSKPGTIFLMENLRFFPEEKKNDKAFAKNLASLGTFYVNDAFSVSHRKNASVEAITKFLPSYGGFLLKKEIENLSLVMKNPKKPFTVILGGAKIADKLELINNFIKSADYFLIGGAMANAFFVAKGLPVGDSLYEKGMVKTAEIILKNKKIIIPLDVIIENRKILDIGAKTVKEYEKIIKKSKTIIFNGPMGYIENLKFSKGTKFIIDALMKSGAKIIIGGGETTPIIQNAKSNIFLSTGGGAMLEYLSGKKLPGLSALES